MNTTNPTAQMVTSGQIKGFRRKFNKVGCPQLPANPTRIEIAQYLKDKAIWQQIQPYGREMDAREWAATCLNTAAEDIEAAAQASECICKEGFGMNLSCPIHAAQASEPCPVCGHGLAAAFKVTLQPPQASEHVTPAVAQADAQSDASERMAAATAYNAGVKMGKTSVEFEHISKEKWIEAYQNQINELTKENEQLRAAQASEPDTGAAGSPRVSFEDVKKRVESFVAEMKRKRIHVGMGSPPVCITCGKPWKECQEGKP